MSFWLLHKVVEKAVLKQQWVEDFHDIYNVVVCHKWIYYSSLLLAQCFQLVSREEVSSASVFTPLTTCCCAHNPTLWHPMRSLLITVRVPLQYTCI